MQEQKYSDENPIKPYLQYYADYAKNYRAHDYICYGRYGSLDVPDDQKERIENDFLKIQTICLPTIRKLRNTQNIAQLQERIYLKLKMYEDKFNDCFAKARSPSQGDYCFDQLHNNLSVDFIPKLTKILEEY